MPSSHPTHIAWFITPHGFGHAARAAAIMLALSRRIPLRFEIFTRVPRWFFAESNLTGYTYHECLTDIGLAQRTSLDEDLPETLQRLAAFLPFDPDLVAQLARQVKSSGCQLVVCDIAPLGIAVAEAAGLPSILVENFTWDWIYAGYQDVAEDIFKYISILKNWFDRASLHIQTEPICAPAPCVLTTHPVSRPLLRSRQEIRARLGLADDAPAVLITMGGIETQFDALQRLQDFHGVSFIIPGGAQEMTRRGPVVLLPHHSGFYHPDLLAACDAVVGKLGYSTLAEACNAGIPYGFIPRARFRESPPLARFVREQMQGIEISEQAFASGAWLGALPGLLAMQRSQPPAQNGADQLAEWMINSWDGSIAR
jgi:hypothetical protein